MSFTLKNKVDKICWSWVYVHDLRILEYNKLFTHLTNIGVSPGKYR